MALFTPKPDMSNEELRTRLVHAMTTWDIKQSKSKYYNPHALAIYLERIDKIFEEVEQGGDVVECVMYGLNPAPWLRTWLRGLDPTVDVKRQSWIRNGKVVR